MAGKGTATTVQVSALDLNAAGLTLSIVGGRTLAVGNVTTLAAGLVSNLGLLNTGGFLETGGAFTNAGTGTVASTAAVTLMGGSGTISSGTFSVSAGGLDVAGSQAALLLNGGTVSITGGTTLSAGSLAITTGVTSDALTVSDGNLTVSTGAAAVVTGPVSLTGGTETMSGGSFYDAAGGMTVGNTASLTVSGADVVIAGATTLTAGAAVSAGTFYVTAGGLGIGSGGALTVSGGDATITGPTTLNGGTAILSGGTFYNTSGGLIVGSGGSLAVSGAAASVSGGATLAAGAATVSAGTLYVLDTGLAINANGSLTVDGGYADLVGGVTVASGIASITSGILYGSGSGLSVASGGSLAVSGGDATLGGATSLSGGTATIAGGTLYVSTGGLAISNSGSLAVTGGYASVTGGTTLTAGTALISAGTLYVTSGGLTIGNAGALSASGGNSNITGGVTSSGTLALSGTASVAFDTLTVTGGSFSNSATGAVVSGLASFTGGSITFGGGGFSAGTLSLGNATLTLAGGGVAIGSGGISDAGTITGYGILQGAISGGGSVVASGGTLSLNTAVTSSSAHFLIANSTSSVLRLNGSVAAAATIGFTGTSGVLELRDLTTGGSVDSLNFSGTVSGMAVGTSATAPTDIINVQGATAVAAHLSASTLTITDSTGTIASIALSNTTGGALSSAYADWQADPALGGTDVFLSNVVCFAAGTRILTQHGDVPVEALAEGDMVVTVSTSGDSGSSAGGHVLRPVTWIGQRRLDLSAHPRPELAAPVRIRRDAIAPGLPGRDLLLSPDHCLFLAGRLMPAKLLINGMTIVQERQAPAVHYFHVELARHAVLLAEGVAAESYLDTGNRAFFANAGLAVVLHPEFTLNASLKCWESDACAPLAVDQGTVAPVWQELAWRAAKLGYQPEAFATTCDPALRLVADGRSIRPMAVEDGRHIFVLPGGVRSVRLVSRAGIAADHTPCLDDFRRLGVRVDRIVLRAGCEQTELPADHPGLRRGWHAAEQEGGRLWRWTDGDALLPFGTTQATVVEVWVGDVMTYRLPSAAPARTVARDVAAA